jgi:hypothetical protein
MKGQKKLTCISVKFLQEIPKQVAKPHDLHGFKCVDIIKQNERLYVGMSKECPVLYQHTVAEPLLTISDDLPFF